MNCVFALADFPGRAAIISLCRLHAPGNEALFHERVEKEVDHQHGHTLGLEHCAKPDCVMFSSNSLVGIDRKGKCFCTSYQAAPTALLH